MPVTQSETALALGSFLEHACVRATLVIATVLPVAAIMNTSLILSCQCCADGDGDGGDDDTDGADDK